jgi:Zn-finger domain-containing protein
MEIPTEALAAIGGGVTAVIGTLWLQVRDRIKALEGALKVEQTFIRNTLVGLISDATASMTECGKCSRRHFRTVEILRKRYGDAVLQETHQAMKQAAAEEADTDRHVRPTTSQRGG